MAKIYFLTHLRLIRLLPSLDLCYLEKLLRFENPTTARHIVVTSIKRPFCDFHIFVYIFHTIKVLS